MRTRPLLAAGAAAAMLLLVTGCGHGSPATKDSSDMAHQLEVYRSNQPAPAATFSQYRQTLISVENAQIHGVATTSFFFVQGSATPYKVCPSIGFPVASTSQLTSPQQYVTRGETGITALPQIDPNGVFGGDSTGTYVTCVLPDGTKTISYAEGFVHTEGGPAHWDKNAGGIIADGAPTVTTSGK